jgi:hypothetical protein
MKTKGLQVILITFAVAFFTFSSASAHKPTTINLSYDLSSKSLSVWVGYGTADNYASYVKTIEIKLNGKSYETYSYKYQLNKFGTATRSYNVDAKPGDVIEVTATSTTNESKTESLTVEAKKK